MELRPRQVTLVNNTAKMFASGKQSIIAQAPTGFGKTVCFSFITKRFIEKSGKKVVITVHRIELVEQTLDKLKKIGVHAAPVIAGCKKLPIARVYVTMTETASNRLQRDNNFFGEIGMLIADEAHLANHFKLFKYFPNSMILGFSATPISSRVDKPLRNYFEEIVCGDDILELISAGDLTQNITYSIKGNFDRDNAVKRGGEFAEPEMANEFSKSFSLHNTISGYEKYCLNSKCVVFNVNVHHSKLVNQLFLDKGYNSRHLDATASVEYRKECLKWLNETPDAILNNVGILTTGFDEPSLDSIIVNKATTSLSLWQQMCGRGGRLFPGKKLFTILDLGGNARSNAHGDWSAQRDWANLFHNPKKKGDGIAPSKECPECERILRISEMICPECQFEYPPPEPKKFDHLPPEFEVVTQSINVEELIQQNQDRKDYFTYFEMTRNMALQFRSVNKGRGLNDNTAIALLEECHKKGKEWCHAKGKRFNKWHQEIAKEILFERLQTYYPSWQPSI